MNAKLEILEQTSLPRLIVYLHRVKKASITDLRNNVKASQSAIYKALDLLKKNELIEEERESGFSRRKTIRLTEKGKQVAESLLNLHQILTRKK